MLQNEVKKTVADSGLVALYRS